MTETPDFSNATLTSYLSGFQVLTEDRNYFFVWKDINEMTAPSQHLGKLWNGDGLMDTLAANTHVCEHLDAPVNYKSHWVDRKKEESCK